jgi:hypothetical protein
MIKRFFTAKYCDCLPIPKTDIIHEVATDNGRGEYIKWDAGEYELIQNKNHSRVRVTRQSRRFYPAIPHGVMVVYG